MTKNVSRRTEKSSAASKHSGRPISGITSNLRSDFATSTNKSSMNDREDDDVEMAHIKVQVPLVASDIDDESYDFSQNRRDCEAAAAQEAQSPGDFDDRDSEDIELDVSLQKGT